MCHCHFLAPAISSRTQPLAIIHFGHLGVWSLNIWEIFAPNLDDAGDCSLTTLDIITIFRFPKESPLASTLPSYHITSVNQKIPFAHHTINHHQLSRFSIRYLIILIHDEEVSTIDITM